jgi:hypothetical protein
MEGHFCFSQELITEITAYYRERGIELSAEEATASLDSLAELWNCLKASIQDGFHPSMSGGGVVPLAARAPEPSSLLSLDNSHKE